MKTISARTKSSKARSNTAHANSQAGCAEATPWAPRLSCESPTPSNTYPAATGRLGFRLLTLHDVVCEESESKADNLESPKKVGLETLAGGPGGNGDIPRLTISRNESRARPARLSLQLRDCLVLRTCAEQRFLWSEHIEEHFFDGCSKQAARKRIAELIEAGYLCREWQHGASRQSLIRATPKTLELLRSELKDKARALPHPRTRIDLNTLAHDALVTHTRLALERRLPGFWVPEFALKSWELASIPDGIFFLENGERWIVEVENSLKSKERLRRLWSYWSEHRESEHVLYVSTTIAIHHTLTRYMDELGPFPKIELLCLANLRSKS